MRSALELRQSWDNVFNDPLLSVERMKQKGLAGDIGGTDARSLYWKVYLEYFPSLNMETWPLIASKERQGYADLKSKFIIDRTKTVDNDPLSLSDENPWSQYFKDSELQKVIRQDVERTFPDQPIFRTDRIQDIMTRILLIWSKLNSDISYRQGMHELLAPILLVVDGDAFDEENDSSGLDEVMLATFDARYIEHDAAVLFFRLMRAAKPWFEVGSEPDYSRPKRAMTRTKYGDYLQSQHPTRQVPILAVCNRVQNDLLRVLDPELHEHLKKEGIEPQLYGIRWLRLLFGREFTLIQLLSLWDGIFADDSNLSLVEWICIALLLYMRRDLIGADYTSTMHRLMKFSPDQLHTSSAQFISSARGLRDRYSQKALTVASNVPSSASARVEQPRAFLAKKRTTVPWVNPLNPISPGADVAGTTISSQAAAEKMESKAPQQEYEIAKLRQELENCRQREKIAAEKIAQCMQLIVDSGAAAMENVVEMLGSVAQDLSGRRQDATRDRESRGNSGNVDAKSTEESVKREKCNKPPAAENDRPSAPDKPTLHISNIRWEGSNPEIRLGLGAPEHATNVIGTDPLQADAMVDTVRAGLTWLGRRIGSSEEIRARELTSLPPARYSAMRQPEYAKDDPLKLS